MRHSFATDFLEKTKNPKALQGLLGHATASQTNHYAKITENLIQDGMEKFDESFEGLGNIELLGRC